MRESIGLSCTVPFRTQMRRSAATASGLYYDRVPLVMHSGCVQDSWRDALWPFPTVSHTGDENERRPQVAGRKNTRPSAVSVGARTWRARQALKFDERLFTQPIGPKLCHDTILCQNETNDR